MKEIVVFAVISFYILTSFCAPHPKQHLEDSDIGNNHFLTPQDFLNAENISQFLPDGDTTYDPNLYEGDIVLSSSQLAELQGLTKNGIRHEKQKWPMGVVPYTISPEFNQEERAIIARGVLEFHRRTCVRFQPWQGNDRDFVAITKGDGCSSSVGRLGSMQTLNLGTGCVSVGIAMHEMMHAIGFWHEQSRWDRDDYVTVYYGNIKEGLAHNFEKLKWDFTQNLSQPYDTESILHYGPYAFTKRQGLPTILPKNPNHQIGQRKDFSKIDVTKINLLYRCPGADPVTTTASPISMTTHGPIPCQDENENCAYWAKKGECNKNPGWMNKHCKMSCNSCRASQCKDNSNHCPHWAKTNECQKNPVYMNHHCAKSCGKCKLNKSTYDST